MRTFADFQLENGESDGAIVSLNGPLRVANLGDIDQRLNTIHERVTRINLSQVEDIDTAGAWLVWRFARDWQAEISGASVEARRLIAAVSTSTGAGEDLSHRPPVLIRLLAWLGSKMMGFFEGVYNVLGFLGALLIAVGSVIRHPRHFRINALVHQMELVGVSAIGIVGLMTFLVGIVIAQQGAEQLSDYGAEAMTPVLTGRLSLRELGIIMAAIMVAGRSGSAFAAQIGTMKLTEEVDAMRTIGVSPMEALVIPRVLACTGMMIPLGFYASLMSIIGGGAISTLTINMPFWSFMAHVQESVPQHDLWVSLIKAPVFGLIIAISGCYNGMQVKQDSEEVGRRTTMAVVAAIFTVIVLDAFFAVFFSSIGWG